MGSSSWTSTAFESYTKTKGCSVTRSTTGSIEVCTDGLQIQDMFREKHINASLNPYNVIRECKDSNEHPNTIPIVIALDTTGSLGVAGIEVAKKINTIIEDLYKRYNDVELLIMGIGDLAYDEAPIQIGQFESDIRIAEQIDKIYMERGGGGNGFESYTAAWYMGARHMNLDCWKRNKKGIIITTGDEPLNPYLPKHELNKVTGDSNEADIETSLLYKEIMPKFDVFHISIDDKHTSFRYYKQSIEQSFGVLLKDRSIISTIDELGGNIVRCIDDALQEVNTDSNNSTIKW